MSRRSIIGAGLVGMAGVLYAAGSPERDAVPPLPTASQAVIAAPPASATTASMKPMPPKQAEAPKGVEAAVVPQHAAPPAVKQSAPAAPSAPRMINGPAGERTRTLPSDGPRNGDVPPVKTADAPVKTQPKIVVAPAPSTPLVTPPPKRTKVAVTRAEPKQRMAKRTSERQIISADASPAPRSNPPPRVQW